MQQEDKKRIAINTVMLYVRMIFIMLVSLFTSRKILEVLGVDDYGIMNVVGGVVSMMTFLNSSMTVATQRFLTYELGRKEDSRFRQVFSMAFYIHLMIAAIILILCETVGLWIVNTILNIPADRMSAANFIYQSSVLSMVILIVRTPYSSAIMAHEKMSFYAYTSIIDIVLKLLIVYLLIIMPFDKLKIYALLLLVVNIFITCLNVVYCDRRFPGCSLMHIWDRSIFNSMVSFTGWNMFGTVAWMLKDQGVNILINLFSGPAVNTARGVSMQVSSAVRNLVSGFQTAVNPQITKSHAGDNLTDMHRLMFTSSKVSFFLYLLLMLPISIETPYILNLWLVEVPGYSVLFTRIILVEALLDTLSGPFITGLMATGKIKWYQIVIGTLIIMNLPISYMLLNLGLPIETPLVVSVLITVIAIAGRAVFTKYMLGIGLRKYFMCVILPVVSVAFLSAVMPMLISMNMESNFVRLITTVLISMVSVAVFSYVVGLDRNEKSFVSNAVRSVLHGNKLYGNVK